ncbi:MAG: hypothetical protein DRP75_04190 [Candidatus Omnitrophota bacterium]|nr:MAG: hypothetical protein DRP75_04190 [Candidatus Omnitrophota bacterium]
MENTGGRMRKGATIEQVENGYIIRLWGSKYCVSKTFYETISIIRNYFGIDKSIPSVKEEKRGDK